MDTFLRLHTAGLCELRRTIAYRIYQESGFNSPEELDAAYHAAHTELADIRKKLNSIETEIKEKKVFRNHLIGYFKTKYLVAELKACKNEKLVRNIVTSTKMIL